jgi:hypothetical protein
MQGAKSGNPLFVKMVVDGKRGEAIFGVSSGEADLLA